MEKNKDHLLKQRGYFSPKTSETKGGRILEEVAWKWRALPQEGLGHVTGSGESSEKPLPGASTMTFTLQYFLNMLVH